MNSKKNMEMANRTVLRHLLEIELENYAIKLKLTNSPKKVISYELMLDTLNLLNQITTGDQSDFNRQVAITAVALLWTHSDQAIKENLRKILTPILATIGFSPSNIMLDESLRENGIYSSFDSYISKLKILVNDRKNQIYVGEKCYTLTSFQSGLWRSIENHKLLGISAPTSAGKSFLIYLKIIDLLHKGAERIVYVVPTLSLISQVTSDISKLMHEHRVLGIDVLNSFEENLNSFIYVVTQERAISIFSEGHVSDLDLLVVDEIQNLEKVSYEGSDRSKILYDVLIDIKNDANVAKIILSGPRLKNIGSLGFRVFGEVSREEQTDSPPVLSLTYSISENKKKYFLNLYSVLFDAPLQVLIENSFHINGLGKSLYNVNFNNYLNQVLDCLKNDVNVVFSPTSNQARKSASDFSKFKGKSNNKWLKSLSEYFKGSVHPKYELAKIVESGVAYHTGKTPMHVRKSIEYATSKQLIKCLFCTTTLMQGMNLPAKNVVIRNPHLFIAKKKGSASLSAYEFANLRGRAGRLLTDFIGRTIVLDEGSFEPSDTSSEASNLFPEEHKDIKTGYQDIYDQNSEYIQEKLANNEVAEDGSSKHLITHIRQMLYRYGKEHGMSRLKDVGLSLTSSLLNTAIKGLNELTVDREVVLANRYWDPIDINRLSDKYNAVNQPLVASVYEQGMCQNFLIWMMFLRENFPYYFNRYLAGVESDTYLYGVAKSAESWARETPLIEILQSRFNANEAAIDDKIDSEIEKLSKYVSYGLPMLLKPISDLGRQKGSLISVIELGMYTKVARYLADRGVPRETAIKVSRAHGTKSDAVLDKAILSKALNYWELQHVQHLLN
ncbi:DEAD/DEAH box helicase [Cellvibrio sp. ARAG 10.3]|uniref:DEAD/DEAH box helicase n=1 Tax=Cellvibrio sp. ARAG 10.3 TaxID=3451358 RepID=UPI003F44FA91